MNTKLETQAPPLGDNWELSGPATERLDVNLTNREKLPASPFTVFIKP